MFESRRPDSFNLKGSGFFRTLDFYFLPNNCLTICVLFPKFYIVPDDGKRGLNFVRYADDCIIMVGTPLWDWIILTDDVSRPHTISSDGVVFLVDDTDNNRVLVFAEKDGKFINTQIFEDVGSRPHHTVYDPKTDLFYVWSSLTGEMYVFRDVDKLCF